MLHYLGHCEGVFRRGLNSLFICCVAHIAMCVFVSPSIASEIDHETILADNAERATARGHLMRLNYDLGRFGPQNEVELADAIENARWRLGLTGTDSALSQLNKVLASIPSASEFPCPPQLRQYNTTSMPRENLETKSATLKFTLRGPYPSRYLMQIYERLNKCAPELLARQELIVDDGEVAFDTLRVQAGIPLTQDLIATEIFDSIISNQNEILPKAIVAPVASRVSVIPDTSYTEKFSLTHTSNSGLRVFAKEPNEADLRAACERLGYDSGCGVKTIGSLFDGDSSIPNRYELEVEHYQIEATFYVPEAIRLLIVRDITQHLIGINDELLKNQRIRPDFWAPIVATPLQEHGTMIPEMRDETCDAVQGTSHEPMETRICLAERFGYPFVEGGSADTAFNLIIDGAFNAALNDSEIGDTLSALISQRKIIDNSWKKSTSTSTSLEAMVFGKNLGCDAPFFEEQIRNVEFNTADHGFGRYDPGHSLFIMSLMNGCNHKRYNRAIGGLSSSKSRTTISETLKGAIFVTDFLRQVVAQADDAFDANLSNPEAVKLSISHLGAKQTTAITIVEDTRCGDISQSQLLWEQYKKSRNSLKNHLIENWPLIIVAAPVRCDNAIETCPSDDRDVSQRIIPIICAFNVENNVSLVVASTESWDSNRALLQHWVPKKFSEKLLLAPGCGFFGIDLKLTDSIPDTVWRKRGCGSSYAAPLVGAFASHINADKTCGERNDLIDLSSLRSASDVKSHLIVTSSAPGRNQPSPSHPLQSPSVDDLYGVFHWGRACYTSTNPELGTIWLNVPEANDVPMQQYLREFTGPESTKPCKEFSWGQIRCQGDLVFGNLDPNDVLDPDNTSTNGWNNIAGEDWVGFRRRDGDSGKFDSFHFDNLPRRNRTRIQDQKFIVQSSLHTAPTIGKIRDTPLLSEYCDADNLPASASNKNGCLYVCPVNSECRNSNEARKIPMNLVTHIILPKRDYNSRSERSTARTDSLKFSALKHILDDSQRFFDRGRQFGGN